MLFLPFLLLQLLLHSFFLNSILLDPDDDGSVTPFCYFPGPNQARIRHALRALQGKCNCWSLGQLCCQGHGQCSNRVVGGIDNVAGVKEKCRDRIGEAVVAMARGECVLVKNQRIALEGKLIYMDLQCCLLDGSFPVPLGGSCRSLI